MRIPTRYVAGALCGLLAGCYLGVMSHPGGGGSSGADIADAIQYRDDMGHHPGCSVVNLSYPAASLTGYPCAAKEYPFPSGVSEDVSKPIVLLIHGNSDTPAEFEKYPATTGMPMLSERLTQAGFKTLAVDYRIDLVDDPQSNNTTENAARNVDHGWATPIVEHFLENAMAAYPNRRFTIIGFSLGVTIARDALRRLYIKGTHPFTHVQDVVLLAGANHGVSTFARLCGSNPTMRGRVACQLGPRDNFVPPDFMKALNGANGSYETPCSDGHSAFGDSSACAGTTVRYTTVVMKDIADGSYQDEFVSEASSRLEGADNRHIGLMDTDQSGYFFNGLLKNHYGSARSEAALTIVMDKLTH